MPAAASGSVILLIDNYDSFVFNLARYLDELGCETRVLRNDKASVEEIAAMHPSAIVLSPGPCTPNEAGVSVEVVRRLGPSIPLLGVCLGHQAIAAAYGAEIVRAPEPMHGQTSLMHHQRARLFEGLPDPFPAARYHSLVASRESFPKALRLTAWTVDGLVMGLEHAQHPVYGVQFHPESVLTSGGHRLLNNFLMLAGLPSGSLPALERELPADEDDFYQQAIAPEAVRPW
jgi:anthranilate synthase/aminodeoxychorismate synthase-like glutamine amidotransferase